MHWEFAWKQNLAEAGKLCDCKTKIMIERDNLHQIKGPVRLSGEGILLVLPIPSLSQLQPVQLNLTMCVRYLKEKIRIRRKKSLPTYINEQKGGRYRGCRATGFLIYSIFDIS